MMQDKQHKTDMTSMETIYALSETVYSFGYQVRQKYGTLQATALNWFSQQGVNLVQQENSQILSLGCGNGAFDLALLKTLQAEDKSFSYTGIDFNHKDLDRFQSRLKEEKPDITRNITLRHEMFDETTVLPTAYDLITMVHFLYAVEDIGGLLETAQKHLSEDGKLLIVQNSRQGVYQVKKQFLDVLPNHRYQASDSVKEALETKRINYTSTNIDAYLDVSILQEWSLEAALLMSFCLGNDVMQLAEQDRERIRQAYLDISSEAEDGRQLLCEPMEMIVCEKKA